MAFDDGFWGKTVLSWAKGLTWDKGCVGLTVCGDGV